MGSRSRYWLWYKDAVRRRGLLPASVRAVRRVARAVTRRAPLAEPDVNPPVGGSSAHPGSPAASSQSRSPYATQYEWSRQRLEGPPATAPQPDDLVPINVGATANDPFLIAFYLPQFHREPVNDAAWGPGFTEWTNVTRGMPQFVGHEQPILPGELGFYDLTDGETIGRQVELATQYGVSGFCFHFYHFDDARPLRRPVDDFMAGQHGFPFCVNWANEPWTKKWDGQSGHIILDQTYSAGFEERLVADLAPYLSHPDAIRVDGRPLFMIYAAGRLPDPVANLARIRAAARTRGLGELHIVAALSFGLTPAVAPGFDDYVQFPPHPQAQEFRVAKHQMLNHQFRGKVFDYAAVAQNCLETAARSPHAIIPAVMPGWDNTARRGSDASIFQARSTESYASWLSRAIHLAPYRLIDGSGRRPVFINAWNEWAEGAVLEPTRHQGHKTLAATRNVVVQARRLGSDFPARRREPTIAPAVQSSGRVALIGHLYYSESWPALQRVIRKLAEVADAFITITGPATAIAHIVRQEPAVVDVSPVPNHGRDILPFLGTLEQVVSWGYTSICKIHGKVSPHMGAAGVRWREQLLDSLAPHDLGAITAALDADPPCVIASSENLVKVWDFTAKDLESAVAHMVAVGRRLGLTEQQVLDDDALFTAGSMFWANTDALTPLIDAGFRRAEFEIECGALDGALPHLLERLILPAARAAGSRVLATTADGTVNEGVAVPGRKHAFLGSMVRPPPATPQAAIRGPGP